MTPIRIVTAFIYLLVVLLVNTVLAETVYSSGWVPPRLVDGMWVTSGVADSVAGEYAEKYNEGRTRRETRDLGWEVYWQWHWEESDAPSWAVKRGDAQQRALARSLSYPTLWGSSVGPMGGVHFLRDPWGRKPYGLGVLPFQKQFEDLTRDWRAGGSTDSQWIRGLNIYEQNRADYNEYMSNQPLFISPDRMREH